MFEKIRYNQSTIHFGELHQSEFQKVLTEEFAGAKKVIITDENVFDLWIQDLTTNYPELSKAEIITIPAGESYKTIEVCAQIWQALSEYEIGRGDLIINFGGGVITDLGGFVASLFKRGLQFVNIPTTLLSQVDASIGGKTGVDLGPYKNQIGVFSDARHVFLDDRYLETLSKEELMSGYAEMLKHGLIADKSYWELLQTFDPTQSEGRLAMIERSVQLKKEVVEDDHKETGRRKILNYGHTIGHGIEGYLLAKETPTLHGYAVAAGMIAEAHISAVLGLLDSDSQNVIVESLTNKFPGIEITDAAFKEVLKLMHNDKKNSQGVISFSLLNGIGNCVYDQSVSDKQILDALKATVGSSSEA